MAEALSLFLEEHRRLYIPCCGQLSIAHVAIASGWKQEQIIASDVSLFTTVLGYYITQQSLEHLAIHVDGEPVDPFDYAGVLYSIKLKTVAARSKHYYQQLLISDFVSRKNEHLAKLQESLTAFDKLRGITYRLQDLFTEASGAIDHPDNVIWLNPPGYYKGYQKMYDTGGAIQWNEPVYTEFHPDSSHDLLREMGEGKPARFLWCRYKTLNNLDKEYVVFADEKGGGKWEYMLCNHHEELASIKKLGCSSSEASVSHNWKLLRADQEITTSSSVAFKKVDKRTALYYRDLLIHKLGVTNAPINYLLVIDESVAGVVGTMAGQCYEGKLRNSFDGYVEECYGMTVYTKHYPYLNKLLMMLIKSEEFLRQYDTFLFKPLGIDTTCLCQYPELKINRGIYKLTSREYKKKTGIYKLRYRGEKTPQNYKEVLAEWLRRYAQ